MIRDWAAPADANRLEPHPARDRDLTAKPEINNGRILRGRVTRSATIDEHPHTVFVRAQDPRGLARDFIDRIDVRSLRFEAGAVVIETGKPDAFYTRVTELAASGEYGTIDEVTSPDDNLAAVFEYLVK